HPNDRVRIIRAIEIHMSDERRPDRGVESIADWQRTTPPWRLLMIGLCQSREALARRIAERVHEMRLRGMMAEVGALLDAGYDEALRAMGGIGYRQFSAARAGRLSEDEALRLMIRDTVRYAKRQMTWFARDPEILWIDVDAAGGADSVAERIRGLAMQEGLIE